MEPNPSQSEELYRAAVGNKKAGYYVPLFQRFDQPEGSVVSWNWPAFFVTFFWLLYRRMYGLAVGYLLLLPIVFAMLVFVIALILGPAVGTLVYWLGSLAVSYVAIPMFANAIYHWHIKRRLANLTAGAPSHEALVQRAIGQAATTNAAVIVGAACLYAVFISGILAAIAIPAYQDYTIRAQVTEGFSLSTPVKVAVAQSYAASGSWPADLSSTGLDDAAYTGRFVSGIQVSDGIILIHYGNAANSHIAGHTLSLHPAAAEDGSIRWSCGYAAGNRAATDVPPKYLPRMCRPETSEVESL